MLDENTRKYYTGFVWDVALNIVSSAIPIAVLQLVILPTIASATSSEKNGQIVTLISFLTLAAEPFGFALNNTKLLVNETYTMEKSRGDFNYLLLISIPLNAIIIIIGTIYYAPDGGAVFVFMMLLTSTIILLQRYFMVFFRLTLNYRRILLDSFFLCTGYLIGLLLFNTSRDWILVYASGSIFSLSQTLWHNKLLKGPIRRTPFFKNILKKNSILLFVEFMNSIVKYADRLILYPLLGGVAVSIYYSATIISKLISLAVTPLSTVILSYFSKMESLKRRTFYVMLSVGLTVGAVCYIFCVLIAESILNWLYPKWAAESMQLVYITTACAVVGAVNNIVRPAVLKFRNISWQLLLGGADTVLYIELAYTFFLIGGLKGFCIGLLINAIIQLFLRVVIFLTQPQST